MMSTIDAVSEEEQRSLFNQKLTSALESRSTSVLSKEEYNHIVWTLQTYDGVKEKPKNAVNIIRGYCLVSLDGEVILVKKNDDYRKAKDQDGNIDSSKVKRLVHADEVYDVIHAAHLKVGHGGGKKTHIEVCSQVSNISRELCHMYRNLCSCYTLDGKRGKSTSGAESSHPMKEGFNSRGQVDIIDMQTAADGNFKWILHYQDSYTKFSYLRALENKTADQVALDLVQIFLMQGAPASLESVTDSELTAAVITELKELWPACTITHGNALASGSQGDQHVEDILNAWMSESKSSAWSLGIHFAANTKNATYHADIGCSPYELQYGKKLRVGAVSSTFTAASSPRPSHDLVTLNFAPSLIIESDPSPEHVIVETDEQEDAAAGAEAQVGTKRKGRGKVLPKSKK